MSEKKDIRIVVIAGGNVHIGEYQRKGDVVLLSRTSVIRVWGTQNGLGQIVDKPTPETILDPCGFVEVPWGQVLFSIKCSSEWPLP